MSEVASNCVLDRAFLHVYQARLQDGPNSDIWSVSLNWASHKGSIRQRLLQGNYQLSPVSVYKHPTAGYLTRWSSMDSIVLKAFAMCLSAVLGTALDTRCYHLKGRGGLKGACRRTMQACQSYRYVCKSDVASFYDSMNHTMVLQEAAQHIQDARLLELLKQYCSRVEVYLGHYRHSASGIPKGCPLSPLVGGFMLKSLDDAMDNSVFYARYMDDWVILVNTRSQLRRVVRQMHHVMKRLGFKLARDKTFIGKVSRGFDFLGYRFSRHGLIGLARITIIKFLERLRRLYEQHASPNRMAQYVRRWRCWCAAGLG